jgi:hypothetical protein
MNVICEIAAPYKIPTIAANAHGLLAADNHEPG